MRSAPENKCCDKSDNQKICVVNGYVVHWWQPWSDARAQIGQATPNPLPAGRVNANLDGVAVAFAGPHFIEEPHVDNLCQFDACLPSRCMKTHISVGLDLSRLTSGFSSSSTIFKWPILFKWRWWPARSSFSRHGVRWTGIGADRSQRAKGLMAAWKRPQEAQKDGS